MGLILLNNVLEVVKSEARGLGLRWLAEAIKVGVVGKVHAYAVLVYTKVFKICIITRISDDLLCSQVNLVEIDIVIKDDEVGPLFLTFFRYLAWTI